MHSELARFRDFAVYDPPSLYSEHWVALSALPLSNSIAKLNFAEFMLEEALRCLHEVSYYPANFEERNARDAERLLTRAFETTKKASTIITDAGLSPDAEITKLCHSVRDYVTHLLVTAYISAGDKMEVSWCANTLVRCRELLGDEVVRLRRPPAFVTPEAQPRRIVEVEPYKPSTFQEFVDACWDLGQEDDFPVQRVQTQLLGYMTTYDPSREELDRAMSWVFNEVETRMAHLDRLEPATWWQTEIDRAAFQMNFVEKGIEMWHRDHHGKSWPNWYPLFNSSVDVVANGIFSDATAIALGASNTNNRYYLHKALEVMQGARIVVNRRDPALFYRRKTGMHQSE